MALTTIPSELSSVSGISDSSTSTAITIDSSQNVSFAGTITATAATQAASDNSTKLATTAYVTTALANLVDSAPGTLNTLNELAAALGDDANFSTTVTNSIATKLPLTGGTLTGGLTATALAVNSGGSTSDISGTAIFRIMGSDVRITNTSGSEAMATFAADGAVSLFHDASTKLATTSTGITVTGTLNGITTTRSVSGTRWGVLPEVASNGVLEIGRYLDFHATSGDTSDYGARFDYDGSKMILTSAMQIEGATTLNNNVSIGTVNTARKLNIKSGTRNATTFAIEDASSTEEVVRIGQQGDGDGFFQLRNTAGAGTILLDASGINYISGGNVGIGTSNPEAKLHVSNSNSGGVGSVLVLDNPSTSAANNGNQIAFLNDVGASYAGVANARIQTLTTTASSGASALTFTTWNGTTEAEKVRIGDNGYVGFGTTALNKFFNLVDGAQGGEEI